MDDARIGQLCRNGDTLFYFFAPDGEYVEKESESEILAALAGADPSAARATGQHFHNFAALKSAMTTARQAAETDARRTCGRGIYRSRGHWLCTLDANGVLVAPCAENFYSKPLTAKQLQQLIDRVLASHPDVHSITVAGGFDYATTLREFEDMAYDPWVSDWCLTAWTRPVTPHP